LTSKSKPLQITYAKKLGQNWKRGDRLEKYRALHENQKNLSNTRK